MSVTKWLSSSCGATLAEFPVKAYTVFHQRDPADTHTATLRHLPSGSINSCPCLPRILNISRAIPPHC